MVVKSAISGAMGGLVGFGITKGVNYMQVSSFLKENVLSERRNNVKSAFGNDRRTTTLKHDICVIRYYGKESSKMSNWYTPYTYNNPISKLALPPGNSGEYIDEKTIPCGTKILEGSVAPNFGQIGGGYQYYVPNPEIVQ